ncbi:MAG TPA: hypothetical protein VFN09_05090, partial [Rhodanobacteraceae bacterium]|nr:hypothetical protein [Rhodanobacteraceae bacterium]
MGKFHFGPIRALAWVTATAFACAGASAAVLTVGPPSETAGCAYPTIQAAIDAAAASPGLDIIRIARGTYPAQHLLINDNGDLAIEGGFVSCQTLVHADYSTLDGYNSPQPGPVIEERSHGNLTLSDLHIQNADATRTGATTGVGGGVAALGRGLLTIRRSVFSGNRAVL